MPEPEDFVLYLEASSHSPGAATRELCMKI
jgi:hypothetical protein